MAREMDAAPKLPVQQLAILSVARFAEPMAYTSVFPYLPNMIRDFGIPPDKVAKWAGFTSATFSISQSMFAVAWGNASDRFGRKPVLICGLLNTMVCFIIWGVSTSLPMAIVVRAIQGAGNGNVGIIRTMVAELVTQKELQPRAFSIMPLVWSLGSVVGPAFGGFLAQPVKQFPNLFGRSEFFARYPYLLPNLIATVFFLISAGSALLFLRETHRDKRNRRDWGLLLGERLVRAFRRKPSEKAVSPHPTVLPHDDESTTPLASAQGATPKHKKTPSAASPSRGSVTMKEVFTYQTTVNLVSYFFLCFHSVAFDQNVTVFLDYPVIPRTPENTRFPFKFTGGFGLDSGTIGTLFVMYGLVSGLVQFLLYPPLVRTLGVLKCFRICSVLTPFIYLITPFISLLPTPTSRFTAILLLMMAKACIIIVAFPSTTILLTNSANSMRILGTLNGFATMFSGIGRAIGPASAGLAFTWGAQNGYIITAYFFLALTAAVGAIPAFYIEDGDGPSAELDSEDESEDEIDHYSDDDSVVETSDRDDRPTASSPLLGSNQRLDYKTANYSNGSHGRQGGG